MNEDGQREIKALIAAEPDLVDRIFEYLLAEFPALGADAVGLRRARAAVRAEFAGEEVYIPKRASVEAAEEVLRLFNGRNANEIARRLGISRRTVYRYLKQPGK